MTHHNMSTFFSGTDWSQLEDRGSISNYLLMLIVNIKGDAIAKVAFKAKKDGNDATVLNFTNNADGYAPLTLGAKKEKEVLVVMDCKIVWETPEVVVEPSFAERYEKVKKAIEEEKAKTPVYSGGYSGKTTSRWNTTLQKWEDVPIGSNYGGVGPYSGYTPKPYSGIDDEAVQGELFDGGGKSIMEMTDEEWRQYSNKGAMEPDFDFRDVYALTNCVLGDTNNLIYTSPISKLLDKDKTLKTKKELDKFVKNFFIEAAKRFKTAFDPLYDEEDYLSLLDEMQVTFVRYTYNRLIKELAEACETEIFTYYEIAK